MQQSKDMCLLTMYSLRFVGDVQTCIVCCVFQSLMEQVRFYVQIDCLWPTFSVGSWSVVLFSLGRDAANCKMLAALCMSVSYLSSFLIFLFVDVQN